MQDAMNIFNAPLSGLSEGDWVKTLAGIAREHGYFKALGTKHFAAYVSAKPTLLVTFETVQGIRSLDDEAQPVGWEMVKAIGWSHLAIVSQGDTWFRDENVYEYFDGLVDEGFFDEFDTVLFYGAGPCGYAAAAFSVAAPGSTVISVQPQATLNPEIAEWDDRFVDQRRLNFTSRYGYAPDMLDAAKQAFVLYDPCVTFDAMHAALFTRPNVTKLPMRHMGATIQTHLMEMHLLFRVLARAGIGKLTRQSFGQMYRKRRDYPPYLRNLLARLDMEDRAYLSQLLCKNVTSRMKAPKFARRLRELQDPETG